MSADNNRNTVGFCTCEDWETCACGDPEIHCMYCCLPLTKEQIAQWNFEEWDFIPPRPKGLPIQISCGACQITIDNPTQEQVDYHFSEEHNVRKT